MKAFVKKSPWSWIVVVVGVFALGQQAYANLPGFGRVDTYTYYSSAAQTNVVGSKVVANCDDGAPHTSVSGVVTPYFKFKRTSCAASGW